MKIVETNVLEHYIPTTIEEMIRLSEKEKFTAKQTINGVTVIVNGDSDANIILRDQQRAQSHYIKGEVGPYPKRRLTIKDKANDNLMKYRDEKKRNRHLTHAVEGLLRLKSRLLQSPTIELVDESKWKELKKNAPKNIGVEMVLRCTETWACLMQLEMSRGAKLEYVAYRTLIEAETGEEMNCVQRHMATKLLSEHWKHGAQLLRWYEAREKRRKDKKV